MVTRLVYIFLFIINGTLLHSQFNLINYSVNDGLPSPETYFIYQDHDGYIWVCTDRGLARYNGYEFENFSTSDGLTNNTIFKVFEDKAHNLWFTCYDGSITIFDYLDKVFKPFWGNDHIMPKLKSRMWLSNIGFAGDVVECGTTEVGKHNIRINLRDSTISTFSNDISKLTEYENFFSEILFVDNEFLSENIFFKKEETTPFTAFPVSNQINNYAWLFDHEFLYFINQNIWIIDKTDTINIDMGEEITSALKDREGNYWVSTLKSGVYKIPSLDIRFYQPRHALEYADRFLSLYRHNEKLFIESEYHKIFEFENQRKRFKKLNELFQIRVEPKIYTPSDSLIPVDNIFLNPSNESVTVRTDYEWLSKGQKKKRVVAFHRLGTEIYFSTFRDLYQVFNKDTIVKITDKYDVGGTTVRSITSTSDSTLVLGTTGKGVILLKDKCRLNIQENDGLLSDLINDVIVEKNGILWCGTNMGISKVEYSLRPEEGFAIDKVTNISYNDGLASSFIKKLSYTNNTIFALSESGLTEFKADIALKKKIAPNIHILSLTHNEEDYASGSCFNYDENNLNIKFIGISSNKPISQDFYQYKLESNGNSSKWLSTNNRSVAFTQLAPGDYTFSVTARAENGDWADPKHINFTINPHWTQLWWVQTLFAFLAIGLLYILYIRGVKRKSNSLKKQLEEEQILNRLKSAELDVLRGQMNPHFVYNSLSSVQRYLQEEKKVDANEFIGRLSKLLRLGLQHSRSAFVAIEDEIEFITNYLNIETQRVPDRFSFNFEIDNRLDNDIRIPSMMIQPLCENVIKHSYDGSHVHIKVCFEYYSENSIKVKISDDGIGYLNSLSKTNKSPNRSLGLEILSQRIQLFKNQNLEANYCIQTLDEDHGNGTSVELILPIE